MQSLCRPAPVGSLSPWVSAWAWLGRALDGARSNFIRCGRLAPAFHFSYPPECCLAGEELRLALCGPSEHPATILNLQEKAPRREACFSVGSECRQDTRKQVTAARFRTKRAGMITGAREQVLGETRGQPAPFSLQHGGASGAIAPKWRCAWAQADREALGVRLPPACADVLLLPLATSVTLHQ